MIRWCFTVSAVRLVRVNRRDSLLAGLVALIWGLNFVVIDVGMGEVPPLVFLAVRFLVVLVPAVFLLPRPPVPWRTVLAVGAFMSLGQFGFLYVAMHAGMPAGLAGLVLQAQVVLTIVLAAVVLRERPTRGQVVGVGLGALGLLVVAFGRGGHVPLVALLLCLTAALMWAIGNVVSRASGATGGLALTVWSALVVPGPLLVLAVLLDGPGVLAEAAAAFDLAALLSTLYTAVLASLVGYGIFNGLLARNPSAAVVPWILLVPPVSIGSAWVLLDEVPSAGELLGGVVLVLGVLVALRPARKTEPAPGTSAPGLGVARTTVQGGQGGRHPTRGEVGGAGLDLGRRAEGDRADLAGLEHRAVQGGPGEHPAVEDQADGVVPAAPRRQPVGEQQGARRDGEAELLLDLPGHCETR